MIGSKMAAKAVESSVKKELKSAMPQAPSGARRRSKLFPVENYEWLHCKEYVSDCVRRINYL